MDSFSGSSGVDKKKLMNKLCSAKYKLFTSYPHVEALADDIKKSKRTKAADGKSIIRIVVLDTDFQTVSFFSFSKFSNLIAPLFGRVCI